MFHNTADRDTSNFFFHIPPVVARIHALRFSVAVILDFIEQLRLSSQLRPLLSNNSCVHVLIYIYTSVSM